MSEAYIVDAMRTATGRRDGRLANWHPADLGAHVLDRVVERTGIDPACVEDVVMGGVNQVGEQGGNIGRNAVLASHLPSSVPAVSLDRQCGSSQQSIHFAAQAVMSGAQDVVVAAGVESMTRVPLFSSMKGGEGPLSQRIKDRFGVDSFSQFVGAEMIAKKYGLTRGQLDEFSVESHRRAAAATRDGAFRDEIVSIELSDGTSHAEDEGIRYEANLESVSALQPLQEGGRISAANASQISDGASAVMVMSERALRAHSLTPLARVHHMTVTAGDPVIMLEEPINATHTALGKTGLAIEDIDLYEVNEAFAPVPLAWLQATGADPQRLNVNGGAIALGHPLGATGAKLMATLVHALRVGGKRWGLQTMCEGGGISNVTIIEAL